MSCELLGRVGKVLLAALSAVFILFLHTSTVGQTKGICPDDLTGYTVSAIKVHTSFGFTKAAKKVIDDTVNSAEGGLKVDGPFGTAAQTATVKALNKLATANAREARLKGPVVLPVIVFPSVRACDNTAKTLEAHFYAYSVNPQTFLSTLLGAGSGGGSRSAPSTPLTRFIAAINPKPFVGFNRSRGVFGGGSVRVPLDNPVVNEIDAGGSGSGSSAEAWAGFEGSRELARALMAHAEWKVGYTYSNVPSTSNDLKEGNAFGQFIGATRPVGRLGFVARYGAAVEAGNKQTDLDPHLLPPDVLTSSRYNSLKVFAGGLFETGRQSFEVSYGLEAGNAKGGLAVDYLKHVFDTGYALRFIPFRHRPFTLDARFAAGSIDRRGDVPLPARFFGGNVERNFISSDNWLIRGDPFIRSFPQNRLLPIGQTFAEGGDKFGAFNLTAAATFWARPLVPDEVSSSKDFENKLQSAKAGAYPLLVEQALIELGAPLRSFAKDRVRLRPALDSLLTTLAGLKGTFAAGSGDEALYQETVQTACGVATTLDRIALTLEDPSAVTRVCGKEVKPDGRALVWLDELLLRSNPALTSAFHDLSCDLLNLAEALKRAGAPDSQVKAIAEVALQVEADRRTACAYACLKLGSTESAQYEVGLDLASCDSGSASGTGPLCPSPCSSYVSAEDAASTDKARRESKEILDYSGNLVRRIAKEQNLIAVGPVFMLDAARIAERGQSLGDAPTRYGVGAGARLSLVSLDLTIGYSFNIMRRINEPRGAFVFSLNVTDLLK
jgi:hypothetical protein